MVSSKKFESEKETKRLLLFSRQVFNFVFSFFTLVSPLVQMVYVYCRVGCSKNVFPSLQLLTVPEIEGFNEKKNLHFDLIYHIRKTVNKKFLHKNYSM